MLIAAERDPVVIVALPMNRVPVLKWRFWKVIGSEPDRAVKVRFPATKFLVKRRRQWRSGAASVGKAG